MGLVGGGGHPIGPVGTRIGGGTVEYSAQSFVEYLSHPSAVAYLRMLRVPYLTLLRTHGERLPDNPRWK